jgi:serine/threonine-protein kinase
MRPNPGDVIGGKYRVVRLIGDGGMGAVYEARHEVLGSAVALKFLHAELAKRPGLSSRFLQEAKVSASIQSPHVTRVTDVDQTPDGSPFLVMELLSGESLQQLLDRKIKLPRDQAIDFALQILSGLEAAHALGVVHRDLKPDNVFITPSTGGPIVKLLDFGIAKLRASNEYQKGLTRPGAVMGTPEYMAPEQLYAADRVDHRADIYSLGAILYEMLTGERPAYGDDAPQIIAQVAQGKVKRIAEHDPSIPEGLAAVVHNAIAADKDQRYASAMDMRLALAPFAGQLSHAGRLAATPAPASVIPAPEAQVSAQARPPATVDAPVLSGPADTSGGVPPTLPPDDRAGALDTTAPQAGAPPRGSTQEAPKGTMEQIAAGMPAGGTSHMAAAPRGAQPPGPIAGAPVYHGSPQSYYTAPPMPPRRKPRRALGAVLALLAGALVTGGIIAVVVMQRQNQPDEPLTPLVGAGGSTPATTISAQEGPTPATPPPIEPGSPPAETQPPSATHPATGGTHPAQHPTADGGTAAKRDAGRPGFPSFPGIQLPSGFPQIPSAIPTTFPTNFPQIPGLPQAPGKKPPPASSK